MCFVENEKGIKTKWACRSAWVNTSIPLFKLLVSLNISTNNSEAKRLIKDRGVKIDDIVIVDPNHLSQLEWWGGFMQLKRSCWLIMPKQENDFIAEEDLETEWHLLTIKDKTENV